MENNFYKIKIFFNIVLCKYSKSLIIWHQVTGNFRMPFGDKFCFFKNIFLPKDWSIQIRNIWIDIGN